MNRIPPAIPRAGGYEAFRNDPLGFLARARARHGNVFVIGEGGPIFSRAPDCCGAVAVFGTEGQREVLSDIETFGMPPSAAEQLALPDNLAALNRGLHSMRGDEHAGQKRSISRLLADEQLRDHHELIVAALDGFVEQWQPGSRIGLLGEMQALALQLASRVLFGRRFAEHDGLGRLLHAYFTIRREASSPVNEPGGVPPRVLIAVGDALDDALHAYLRDCRRSRGARDGGLLGELAARGGPFSKEQVVGHSNILFVSTTEPIAVALTWILLILSQLPGLRGALRDELRGRKNERAEPGPGRPKRPSLLDCVILESLRLLPPNGFMARVTMQPTSLCGSPLPDRCEVVLCPLVAHRDAERFERADEFLPARWHDARPSPFDYFPFGAGGHACPGRGLAHYLMNTVLSVLLERFDLVFSEDQAVDWRVHIMFMPSADPSVAVLTAGAKGPQVGGRLLGPVARLLRFPELQTSDDIRAALGDP
jgi:cytochrome P450